MHGSKYVAEKKVHLHLTYSAPSWLVNCNAQVIGHDNVSLSLVPSSRQQHALFPQQLLLLQALTDHITVQVWTFLHLTTSSSPCAHAHSPQRSGPILINCLRLGVDLNGLGSHGQALEVTKIGHHTTQTGHTWPLLGRALVIQIQSPTWPWFESMAAALLWLSASKGEPTLPSIRFQLCSSSTRNNTSLMPGTSPMSSPSTSNIIPHSIPSLLSSGHNTCC